MSQLAREPGTRASGCEGPRGASGLDPPRARARGGRGAARPGAGRRDRPRASR